MVPEPGSASTAACASVAPQKTAERDPEKLHLTPENVAALGAGLPGTEDTAADPDSPAGPSKRRAGRRGKHKSKPRRVRKAKERSNRAVCQSSQPDTGQPATSSAGYGAFRNWQSSSWPEKTSKPTSGGLPMPSPKVLALIPPA